MSFELGTTASSGYSNPITISPAVSSSSAGFFNPSSSRYRISSSNETDAVAGLIVILCELCCMCCTPVSSVFTTTESGLPAQDGYITQQPSDSKGEFYKPLGEPTTYPTSTSSGWFTISEKERDCLQCLEFCHALLVCCYVCVGCCEMFAACCK